LRRLLLLLGMLDLGRLLLLLLLGVIFIVPYVSLPLFHLVMGARG
jgi:hypothetical protein